MDNPSDDAVRGATLPIYFCSSRRKPMAIIVGPTVPPIPAGMIDYVGNAGTEEFLEPVQLQIVNGIAVDIPGAAVGNGTDGVVVRKPSGFPNRGQSLRLSIITDGTSNTLLIGEKRLRPENLGRPQPHDDQGFTSGWDRDEVCWGNVPPDIDRRGQDGFYQFGSAHPAASTPCFATALSGLIRYNIQSNNTPTATARSASGSASASARMARPWMTGANALRFAESVLSMLPHTRFLVVSLLGFGALIPQADVASRNSIRARQDHRLWRGAADRGRNSLQAKCSPGFGGDRPDSKGWLVFCLDALARRRGLGRRLQGGNHRHAQERKAHSIAERYADFEKADLQFTVAPRGKLLHVRREEVGPRTSVWNGPKSTIRLARPGSPRLVAALPIVLLARLAGLLDWSCPAGGGAGPGFGAGVAIFVYGMPWQMALASAGYGACFGLFPIGWIVLAAIFLYSLTVQTGQFEIVKNSVAALSADRRMQALLIAFSFGAFVEGAAGFGTPVAISAALMIGAGLLAAARRRAGADRQHVAGGLRRAGHADHDAGRRDRARRDEAERDGRPAAAVLLADRAGLAGVDDGRLARRARRLAGDPGQRRQLCRRAVLGRPTISARGWSMWPAASFRWCAWPCF